MGYGWDVEEVDDGDEEDLDEEHPFGEDEELEDDGPPPGLEDGPEDGVEDDFSGESDGEDGSSDKKSGKKKGKKKQGEADGEVEAEDVKEGGSKKKKKADPDPEQMKSIADRYGMPKEIFPIPCPKCKKKSLFIGPYVPTGIRIAVVIAAACFGAVNMDKALSSVHFRCLNPKCKSNWKQFGTYYILKPTGKLEEKNPIWRIPK